MLALRAMDLRSNFDRIGEIIRTGERILVSRRPSSQNFVILSEKDYKELAKNKRNAEYLAKIDRSVQQLADGKVVVKTMKDLEAMAQ